MRNIVLDCDPGHDDAVAIMLVGAKCFDFNLLGISVASGNQTLEKTGRNALNITSYLGIDVPIALGSSKPIKKAPMICSEIHGETGLDGFDFPKYNKSFDKRDGAQLIIDSILNNDNVTVVTTGPLTNLAIAMLRNKDIINKIKEVVFMGGSISNGNVTPAAEFNILVDPEAADIVIKSGVKVKMVGLDVTRKVMVYDDIINEIQKIGGKAAELFVPLMKVFNENQRKTFGIEAGPLHDPVTIASLIDEECVKFIHCNTQIDTDGGQSYGRTNCDIFDYQHLPKNSYVAIDIDREKFWNIIKKAIFSYK